MIFERKRQKIHDYFYVRELTNMPNVLEKWVAL